MDKDKMIKQVMKISNIEKQVEETSIQLEKKANLYSVDITMAPFNAKADGITDNTQAFRDAINYLTLKGGGELLIPNTGGVYLVKFIPNSTIDSPTRIKISCNNINIRGIGKPTIKMSGLTKQYLESINDNSSSGRDVFTVFSFVGCANCSIDNLNFEGEWDGEGTHRFASPRAKAIGILGCSNIRISNLDGTRILGNLINATDAKSVYDGISKLTNKITVLNCYAKQCYENGINFMGGTSDCTISDCICEYNGTNGFESGTSSINITRLICNYNKANGISASGSNTTIVGNVCNNNGNGVLNGVGIQISYSSDIKTNNILITNNICNNNGGFGCHIYPLVKGVNILNNTFIDNCNDNKANTNYGIYAVGTTTNRITDIIISNNIISDSIGNMIYGTILGFCDNVIISCNMVTMASDKLYSLVAQSNSTNIRIFNNSVNKPPLVSNDGLNCCRFFNFGYSPNFTEATTVPSTGTWKIGDYVKNISTSETGTTGGKYVIIGWACVSSGTPGLWRECRVLTGN